MNREELEKAMKAISEHLSKCGEYSDHFASAVNAMFAEQRYCLTHPAILPKDSPIAPLHLQSHVRRARGLAEDYMRLAEEIEKLEYFVIRASTDWKEE